jgi:hypothetical protein
MTEMKLNTIQKFVDATKLGKRMITEREKKKLQEALDALCSWLEG